MKKTVKQIRELGTIEKELQTNPVGVLAAIIENDQITQLTTTFLYLDKNIYIFFSEENEIYENLQFDNIGTFTVIKSSKSTKSNKNKFESTYHFMSISISGTLKKIDEVKTLEELRNHYLKKYKKELSEEINFSSLINVIMIDSEEIQAFEESGG